MKKLFYETKSLIVDEEKGDLGLPQDPVWAPAIIDLRKVDAFLENIVKDNMEPCTSISMASGEFINIIDKYSDFKGVMTRANLHL